jgi:hypothetical protein
MSHLTCRLAHQRSNVAFFICNSSSGTNHRSLSSLWSWRRNSAVSNQSSLSEIGLKRTPICERRDAERAEAAVECVIPPPRPQLYIGSLADICACILLDSLVSDRKMDLYWQDELKNEFQESLSEFGSDTQGVVRILDGTFRDLACHNFSPATSFAYGLLRIGQKHHQGLLSLIQDKNYAAAHALMRPCVETITRAVWVARQGDGFQLEKTLVQNKIAGLPFFHGMELSKAYIIDGKAVMNRQNRPNRRSLTQTFRAVSCVVAGQFTTKFLFTRGIASPPRTLLHSQHRRLTWGRLEDCADTACTI